jgi:hypothetical protein
MGNASPAACQQFCGCIYNQGNPLNACLDTFQKAKQAEALDQRQAK